jgi:hypothetical protein
MIQWLRRLLYESTAAEFRSSFSVAESVERLRAATKRSAFSALGETAAVGKVSPDTVRLQRVIPMMHNSFKPFFVGRFEVRDGVTVLTGQFGMTVFVKVFMSFWLGMVAFIGAGLLLGSFSAKTPSSAVAAVGPLFMVAAGLGLVALGKWFARNDVAWLSGVITHALGVPGVGAQKGEETKIDPAAVPMVLKGVALFLAASGVMALFANFVEPKMGGAPTGAPQMGHWNIVYAVMAFVLAMGVWRRRPWAWWGGFLVLALPIVSPVFYMGDDAQMMPPQYIRVVFVIFSLIVVAVWGRWWYAQRRHFLWPAGPVV